MMTKPPRQPERREDSTRRAPPPDKCWIATMRRFSGGDVQAIFRDYWPDPHRILLANKK